MSALQELGRVLQNDPFRTSLELVDHTVIDWKNRVPYELSDGVIRPVRSTTEEYLYFPSDALDRFESRLDGRYLTLNEVGQVLQGTYFHRDIEHEDVEFINGILQQLRAGDVKESPVEEFPLDMGFFPLRQLELIHGISGAYNVRLRRGVSDSCVIYRGANLSGLPQKKTLEIHRYLLNITENDNEAIAPPATSFVITTETSAEIVGRMNGYVFKVYKDSRKARKEQLCLQRFAHSDDLAANVQKLSLLRDVNDLPPCPLVITDDEMLTKVGLAEKLTMLETGRPQLLKTTRLSRIGTRSDLLAYESQSMDRFIQRFAEFTKRVGVEFSQLAPNVIIQRLAVLATLHSHARNLFTPREKTDDIGIAYHDFKYHDIRDLVSPAVGEAYKTASKRQKQRFRERQHSLVFTHGDAKWDNWILKVLIDFGSAKISTEYKDVAKSLLDSTALMGYHVEDPFINYFQLHTGEEAPEEFMTFIAARSPRQHLPQMEEYMVGGTNFHDREWMYAARLFSGYPEIEDVFTQLNDGDITWQECQELYKTNQRERQPHQRNLALVDAYIDAYIELRDINDNPIQETTAEFKLHVHDSILLESVRTIQYKVGNPRFKLICTELEIIAEAYAELI